MRILYSELRTDSLLQTILTVLTVLPVLSVPGLYLLGVTHHQGYLHAFGIDDSLFPLSFEKALLSGFRALGMFGLVPLIYTIGIAFVLLYALIIASHPRVRHWRSIVRDKLPKWRATNAPSEARNYFENKSATIVGCFIGYSQYGLAVLILLFLVAHRSYNTGQEEAVKLISSLKDKTGNYVVLYSPLFPDGKLSRQIICGQSHCAFWLGSETLVLRHESIERMEMHNPAVEERLRDKAAQRPSP